MPLGVIRNRNRFRLDGCVFDWRVCSCTHDRSCDECRFFRDADGQLQRNCQSQNHRFNFLARGVSNGTGHESKYPERHENADDGEDLFHGPLPVLYHPPPPPPPDELLLELLELPLELLELGAATPAAIPAAAAAHVAVAPAPPESPPPPVQPVDDAVWAAVKFEVEVDELLLVMRSHVEVLVADFALWVDQTSTCLPSPNASSHGYQLSLRFGRG